MPTIVINLRDRAAVAEARRLGLLVRIDRPSVWSNPYRIGPSRRPDADGDRATVVAKHRAWLAQQPHLLARLGELRGRRLACWCAPTGGMPGNFEGTTCHGEILAALADAQADAQADETPPHDREAPAAHEAAHEAAHVGASGGSPMRPPTPPGDLTRRAALLGAVGLAMLGAGVTTTLTLADPNNAASTQNHTGTPTRPTGPISTARGTEGQEQESPTAAGNAGATPAPAPTQIPTDTPPATRSATPTEPTSTPAATPTPTSTPNLGGG